VNGPGQRRTTVLLVEDDDTLRSTLATMRRDHDARIADVG